MSNIDIEGTLKKKANALAAFCSLTDDKRRDITSLFDELLDATGDPNIARRLVRLIDSFDDCAGLITSSHRDNVRQSDGEHQT